AGGVRRLQHRQPVPPPAPVLRTRLVTAHNFGGRVGQICPPERPSAMRSNDVEYAAEIADPHGTFRKRRRGARWLLARSVDVDGSRDADAEGTLDVGTER